MFEKKKKKKEQPHFEQRNYICFRHTAKCDFRMIRRYLKVQY